MSMVEDDAVSHYWWDVTASMITQLSPNMMEIQAKGKKKTEYEHLLSLEARLLIKQTQDRLQLSNPKILEKLDSAPKRKKRSGKKR